MPNHTFLSRAVPNGIYDRFITKAKADSLSLVNVKPISWSPSRSHQCDGGEHTTRFYLNHSNSRDSEAFVRLAGEVLSPEEGTKMTAHGGILVRSDDVLSPTFFITFTDHHKLQIIDDSNTIRDVIALGIPTCATASMTSFFEKQLQVLDEIFDVNLGFVSNLLLLTPKC